jgi:hypothetical protein
MQLGSNSSSKLLNYEKKKCLRVKFKILKKFRHPEAKQLF